MSVVRDEDGNIVSVVRDQEKEKRKRNPLGDPLNDLSDEDEGDTPIVEGVNERGIVPELEAASRMVKKTRPRKQSEHEVEWIQ